MKTLLITLLLSSTILAQNPIKELKPIDLTTEKPAIKTIFFQPEWFLADIKKLPPLPPLTQKQIQEKFGNKISAYHSVFDITTLATKYLPVTQLPKNHWFAYDLTTQEIVANTAPSLGQFLEDSIRARFHTEYFTQVSTQAQIISVKNPIAAFPEWTTELIKKSDPKPIATFAIIQNSSQRSSTISPAVRHQKNKLEIETTISTGNRLLDHRLNLEIYPTENFQGLSLNTSFTTINNKTLIHPIGISTNPARQTLLILHSKTN